MRVAELTNLDPRTAAYADQVVAQIEATVPVLEAFLLGSAAAGGFRPGESDLDLTAVVERPLGPATEELLRRLRKLDSPVRGLELVLYVEGSQPPALELNVDDGRERPDEEAFWFVLDAALGQEHGVPLLRGRPWSDFFTPVGPEQARAAMRESLEWARRQPEDDEFARLHAIRARHYLDHGDWITKEEAAR
jgi:predicted nucleotidyltransferase